MPVLLLLGGLVDGDIDGIGGVEYAMLRDDERVPLRNKVLKGLYPPGSTVKPMVSMAFMQAGIDPNERVVKGLMEFVSKGVRTSVALSREESERRHALEAEQAEAA